MKDPQDLDGLALYPVRHDVARFQDDQFAGAGNASRSSDARLLGQHCNAIQDSLHHELCSLGVVLGDEAGFVIEIVQRLGQRFLPPHP